MSNVLNNSSSVKNYNSVLFLLNCLKNIRYLNHQRRTINNNQMKKLLFITAFIFNGMLLLQAQNQETVDLTIEISGMETDKGKVFVALYNSEKIFLKSSKATKGTSTTVKDGKAVAHFKGIKKGEYAVSLFHDENENNKMDTKIFGIPKEPYGFSNNATGFMGPPKYKDAKFSLESNKTITISVD